MRTAMGVILLAALSAVLGGCTNVYQPADPAFLKPEAARIARDYSDWDKVLKEYDALPTDQKQAGRDKIIGDMQNMIDGNYRDFEHKLLAGRAYTDLTFDLVTLGLGFSGTVVNGETSKAILAALVTAVTGAKTAYSKNIYNEQAATAIVAKMRALRATALETLEQHKDLPADEYPLVPDAVRDLTNYYGAGTLTSALATIASDAAAEEGKARSQIQSIRNQRAQRMRAARGLPPLPAPAENDKN